MTVEEIRHDQADILNRIARILAQRRGIDPDTLGAVALTAFQHTALRLVQYQSIGAAMDVPIALMIDAWLKLDDLALGLAKENESGEPSP